MFLVYEAAVPDVNDIVLRRESIEFAGAKG
jgi:hypothetical protein